MSILLENKKVAAATHNIMAFRIDVGKGVWAQDCDDDGETGAQRLYPASHSLYVAAVPSLPSPS